MPYFASKLFATLVARIRSSAVYQAILASFFAASVSPGDSTTASGRAASADRTTAKPAVAVRTARRLIGMAISWGKDSAQQGAAVRCWQGQADPFAHCDIRVSGCQNLKFRSGVQGHDVMPLRTQIDRTFDNTLSAVRRRRAQYDTVRTDGDNGAAVFRKIPRLAG